MTSFTLDAGALIALENRRPEIRAFLRRAALSNSDVRIPAGALAQAWRAHPRRHALHVLLGQDHVEVMPLGLTTALGAGALCASTGTSDVIDASVALCAQQHGDVVLTSEPDDIHALDPALAVVTL